MIDVQEQSLYKLSVALQPVRDFTSHAAMEVVIMKSTARSLEV